MWHDLESRSEVRKRLVPSLGFDYREYDSKNYDYRELKSMKNDFAIFDIMRKC